MIFYDIIAHILLRMLYMVIWEAARSLIRHYLCAKTYLYIEVGPRTYTVDFTRNLRIDKFSSANSRCAEKTHAEDAKSINLCQYTVSRRSSTKKGPTDATSLREIYDEYGYIICVRIIMQL